MGKLIVVVGGQFGSEGKGEVAGWLAQRAWAHDERLVAVRVAGPNAGHTVTNGGRKVALRQIPVAAVTHPGATLVVAAGSEVDPEVLKAEVDMLDSLGYNVSSRLVVDQGATVITEAHAKRETEMAGNGTSTGKGIGAARAARAMRKAQTVGDPEHGGATSALLMYALREGATVLIEGAQGYGLGSHTRYYPWVTSSDCRAVDFMAMAGVSPWAPEVHSVTVWVVVRNRSIRIAGDSGPLDDETTWDALGVDPEYTTVTKKVRRVGGFMPELVREAIRANGGPGPNVKVALTHLDHEPGLTGDEEAQDQWLSMQETAIKSPIHAVSRAPGVFLLRRPMIPPPTTSVAGLMPTSIG
jgi:adenylosuccinate synthase